MAGIFAKQIHEMERMMSRKNDIENKLKTMEGGAFQKLAESYVYRKLRLTSLTAIGSQKGTDKVTRGVPDAHSFGEEGVYLIAFTTDQSNSFQKICKDVEDCLMLGSVSDHQLHDVCKIVCCHSCWRLEPWQEQEILNKAPGKVELLGPSTMVEDMIAEYADLAWDYLGVPVGNGSLLTLKAFVDAENRREYTTPHTMALRGRRAELDTLVKTVEECQVALVTGASGLGKTRIALEAVRKYAKKYHCESFVIDSHSSRDVSVDANSFLKYGSAAVLVDDVDQLIDLRPLLQVALLNPELRLVLTVRDYATGKIEEAIRGYMKPTWQSIAPLGKAEVSSLLKEDLGITNPYYIEQIERVAKGNLRLAIMAGMQGKEHGYPAIRNAYSILDLFFSGLAKHLTENDMRILEEFSLNGVSDLEPGDRAYDRIAEFVCEPRLLSASVTRLSSMSIIDMLSNNDGARAVRFEQQNLRDYCIYKALMVDRIIPLEEYIRVMIGARQDELCASLSILLGSFSCTETIEEVQRAACGYWRSLPESDGAARQSAMGVLHQLLEPYDLEYAQCSIDEMADGSIATGEEYQRAAIGAASLPMSIVCGTKGSSRWPVGMDLLIALFEKGGDAVSSYKMAFERLLAPDVVSMANDFKDERRLLSRLLQMVQAGSNQNVSTALHRLCELYLRVQYESVMSGDDPNSFAIKQWQVSDSDSLRSLRELSISGLVTLSHIHEFRKAAINSLFACFSSRGLGEEIAKGDVDSLARCLQENPAPLQGEDKLLYAVQESCSALGLDYEELFDIEVGSEFATALDVFGSSAMDRYLDNTKKLEVLSIADLDALVTYCGSARAAEQLDEYRLYYVTDRAMMFIAKNFEKESVEKAFEHFCANEVPQPLSPPTIKSVIDACGYTYVRYMTLQHSLWGLVAAVDGMIPKSDVSDQTLFEILASQGLSSVWMKVDDINRIDSMQPGFAQRFWRAKEHWLSDDPSSSVHFFNSLGYREGAQELLQRMVGDDTAALKEFFFANMNNPRFDETGAVFEYLFTKGSSIVAELVAVASTGQSHIAGDAIERLGYLSKLPQDSFEWMGKVIDYMADSASPWLVMDLLSEHNTWLWEDFSVLDFIVYYITTRWDDLERVASLRIVLEDLPAQVRYSIYSRVFSQIKDVRLLQFLPVYPMTFLGFGNDGFVPQYVEEIEMLKKLSIELSASSEYVVHRVRIAEMVADLERWMKRERWESFHGR